MKMATRALLNVKSGLPGNATCLLHPFTRDLLSNAAAAISVDRFPRLRIFDITADRISFVNVSAIASGYFSFKRWASTLARTSASDLPG